MLKKLLLIVLMFVIVSKVISAEKYAVIITGDDRYVKADGVFDAEKDRDFPRWWNDTLIMWHLLVKNQGFSVDKVYVLYASGKDYPLTVLQPELIPEQYWMTNYPEYGFRYVEDEDFKQLTYSSASLENIEDIFDSLSTVITKDDFLFVTTISHGDYIGDGSNTDGSMLIYGEELYSAPTISDSAFAEIIEKVPANKKVFWLAQCNSGCFTDNLENMDDNSQKIINTACRYDESSNPADDNAWASQHPHAGEGIEYEHLFDLYQDECVEHDEFTFHLYTSTVGSRPFAFDEVRREESDHPNEYQKPSVTADFEWFNIMEETDINTDRVVTIEESSVWLTNHNSIVSQHSVFSDLGNIGSTTSLMYPTLIFRNYVEYYEDLRGIMGISINLNIVNTDLILIDNSHTTLLENRTINIKSGYSLIVQSGAVLKLKDDTELIIESGANLVIESGAQIVVEGNAKITGDVTLPSEARVELLENATLTINNGSALYLDSKVEINGHEGSSLIIGANSSLITTVQPDYSDSQFYNFIEMTGNNWKGVICEPNSRIVLNRTKISGAECGISGSPNSILINEIGGSCVVEQCEFNNCENGINLVAVANPQIKNNVFNGIDTGVGIYLTQSNGTILGNTIDNFNKGISVYTGSPIVLGNVLTNNRYIGFRTSGLNSYPQLIDPLTKNSALNNTIFNNGEVILEGPTPITNLPSQIYVGFGSNVYLKDGRNNIYSNLVNTTAIPCIQTVSIIEEGSEPIIQLINATNNYWGPGLVTDAYFSIGGLYSIAYIPFSSSLFLESEPLPSYTSSLSTESKLLSHAIEAELGGKTDLAIKKYEHIIDMYPDSEENYIALSRLTDIYVSIEEPLDRLIAIYDENINSDDETINKKFYKEMKVTSYIKENKYDDAIVISEEMKLEASSEEEEILCDIDIAIANMMKNAQNKGKGKSTDHSSTISDLLAKLTDGEEEGEKTDIVEAKLPTEFVLYQNYPNPFNPTTEIKFALPTASDVKLNVYNINGQLVSELVNGNKEAGIHTVNFDASNFNSGMYFYTFESNGMSITKKMILTK